MHFAKIGQGYINLDLVRAVEPEVSDEGSVVRIVVVYSNGDQAVLTDEAAHALLAAIDPPTQSSPGYSRGYSRRG
jgi:hypothetical protein